jgi:simple sugar transport system permease protein
MLEEMLTLGFMTGLLAAAIRLATPLVLGSLGEMFAERSGVLNLGIEGMMLLGALAAFLTVHGGGSLPMGLLAAVLTGLLLAALLSFLTVTLGASQHVAGLGITTLAAGLSMFIYRQSVGAPSVPPHITPFPVLSIPGLSKIPFFGPILFEHSILTYLAFLLVPVAAFVLYRTSFGLSVRAVGDQPGSADTLGVSVSRTRLMALLMAGALAGLAGAFLSISQLNMFVPGIISGRGFVCIAIVVFGNWSPWKIMWGSLLFALVDAFQLRLQQLGAQVPYQYFMMLPYLLTIAALMASSGRSRMPGALLKPYRRE